MRRVLLVFGLVFLFAQQGVFADTLDFAKDSVPADTVGFCSFFLDVGIGIIIDRPDNPPIIYDPPIYDPLYPIYPPGPLPELLPDPYFSMVDSNDLAFVNTLVGIVGTTPAGALTYTIPIQVPTGTAGIQPQLAIVYNSQNNSSGILGIGFGLSGLSSITRVGQNFLHETQRTGVTLTDSDRFALDGQRLIQTGGLSVIARENDFTANGTVGGDFVAAVHRIYDTEMASFSEIERFFHNHYQGPQRWRVITRDGNILSYGNRLDSRMRFKYHAGSIRQYHADSARHVVAAWHINRMEDPNGNFIEFEYYTGPGWANQIRKIRYTGNDSAGISPSNEIIFRYIDKPEHLKRTLFLAGHPIAEQKLLSEIVIVSGTDTVRRYRFQYSTDMSRLLYMRKFDEAGRIIGELRFDWSLAEQGFTAPKRWTTEFGSGGYWRNEHYLRILADITGDGRADVVGFRRHSMEAGLSSESDNFLPSWREDNVLSMQFPRWSENRRSFHLVDVNGDGIADIVGLDWDGVRVGLFGGKDSFPSLELLDLWITLPDTTDWIPFRHPPYLVHPPRFFSLGGPRGTPRHLVDFDGDGLPDIIGHSPSTIAVALNTGKSFEHTFDAEFSSGSFGPTGSVSLVGDINGDGRADIVVLRRNESNSTHSFTLYFALSYGNRLGAQIQTNIETESLATSRRHNFFLNDVNGDGKADFIFAGRKGLYVALSTGRGFAEPTLWIANYGTNTLFSVDPWLKLTMADVNGDGKADVIAFHGETVGVALSTGNSFAEPKDWTMGTNYWGSGQSRWRAPNSIWTSHQTVSNFRTFADVNGDGLPDLVGFDSDGVWVSLNQSGRPMLVGVTDNLGRQFTAEYGFLTDSEVHIRGTEPLAFPLKNFQGPMRVCTRLTTRTSDQRFRYEGAIMHQQGRGFLGFSRVTATDHRLQTRTVAEFELDTTFYLLLPRETRLCARPSQRQARLDETQVYDFDYIAIAATSAYTPISRTWQQNHIQRVSPWQNRITHRVVQRTTYDFLTDVVQVSNFRYDRYGNLLSDTTFRGPIWFGVATFSENLGVVCEGISIGTVRPAPEAVFITRNTFIPSAGRNISNRLRTTISYSYYRATPDVRFPQKQRFGYDTRGNLIEIINRYETTIPTTTTHRINTVGLVDKIKLSAPGIESIVQEFGFDSLYRFQTSQTTGIGRAGRSFDDWGRVLSDTAVGGQVTIFTYDAFGRLVQTTAPGGFITKHTITREKNMAGVAYISLVERPGRPWVRSYLDTLGRTVMTRTPNFSGIVTTKTEFDQRGLVRRVSMPHFQNEFIIRWREFTHDDVGRLRTERFGGLTTTHDHSGRTTSVTDPAGRTTRKTFNTAGDLILVEDPMGGKVHYCYYAPGFVRRIEAPGNAVTTITYDYLGRQISLHDPNAGKIEFGHDALDRIVWQRTARGDTTFSKFDSFGRLWKTIEGDRVTTRNYIASGPNVGRLQSITVDAKNYSSAQIFVYDELGRITKFKDVLGSDTLITQYSYDRFGNLATYTFPSGYRLVYSYNQHGFKFRISDSTQIIWELDAVNAFGQELRSRVVGPPPALVGISPFGNRPHPPALLPAERVRANTFDIFGKPERMIVDGLMHFTYSHCRNTGNMLSRRNPFSGTNDTFGFDDLNRLTTGVRYYPCGNIKWKYGIGYYTYHAEQRHAVVGISEPLSVGRDHSITYTPFQKVNSIYCAYTRLSAGFVYGPTHLRREMVVIFDDHTLTRNYTQNVDISTVRDERGRAVATETKEFIFSPFGLVAIRNNGLVSAVATDHLGSIVAQFNPRRGRGEYEFFGYTAWGRRYRYERGHKHFFDESAGSGWSLSGVETPNPISILDYFARGFTGHEHLDAFGLINMNGRLYDPIIARFLSPDPFVQAPTFSQNFNRFTYAWNNPLRFIDPTGYFNQNIDDAINAINVRLEHQRVCAFNRNAGRGEPMWFDNRWWDNPGDSWLMPGGYWSGGSGGFGFGSGGFGGGRNPFGPQGSLGQLRFVPMTIWTQRGIPFGVEATRHRIYVAIMPEGRPGFEHFDAFAPGAFSGIGGLGAGMREIGGTFAYHRGNIRHYAVNPQTGRMFHGNQYVTVHRMTQWGGIIRGGATVAGVVVGGVQVGHTWHQTGEFGQEAQLAAAVALGQTVGGAIGAGLGAKAFGFGAIPGAIGGAWLGGQAAEFGFNLFNRRR